MRRPASPPPSFQVEMRKRDARADALFAHLPPTQTQYNAPQPDCSHASLAVVPRAELHSLALEVSLADSEHCRHHQDHQVDQERHYGAPRRDL